VVDPRPGVARSSAKYHVAARFGPRPADPASDAVAIATPAEQHARLVTEALEAGKHVFVGKPLALHHRGAGSSERRRSAASCSWSGISSSTTPPSSKCALVREGASGPTALCLSIGLNFGKVRREENILWSFAPTTFL